MMMMMLYYYTLLSFIFCDVCCFNTPTQVEENDDDAGINIEIRETEKQIWSKTFSKSFISVEY